MFRFRLQRVLELKEKQEKEVAIRLAHARAGEEEARAAMAALQSVREEGVQRAHEAQRSSPSIGELQNLRFLVEQLNEALEQAGQEVEGAASEVRRCMDEFTAAFKARKVLDRLRERDQENWRAEEIHADQQTMDEVALTGFTHRKPLSTGKQ